MKKILTLGLILIISVTLIFSMAFAKKNNNDAWIGITTQTVDDELADAFDLDIKYGVIVNMVINDSPAEDAGIREDDIIIAYNSEKIYDYDDLIDYLEDSAPDDKVTLSILRDDKNIEIEVTLNNTPKRSSRSFWSNQGSRHYGKIPPIPPIPPIPSIPSLHGIDIFDGHSSSHGNHYSFTYDNSSYIGVQLSDLSDQLRAYFGIRNDQGVLISEVEENSPAEKSGLLAGDIIIAADNIDIEDYRDLKDAIEDKDDGDIVNITVIRDKNKKQFDVTVAEREDRDRVFYNAPDISFRVPHGKNNMTFFSDDFRDFFNSDDFADEMKELAKELENLKFEISNELFEEFNSKEFKKEMKKFKREMKNEESFNMKELKSELKEIQKELKELEKKIDD